jgi:cytoskeletal protein RodZ
MSEFQIERCKKGGRALEKTQKMSTVAEQLHLAREAKSLSIYQVAEITKIRTDHIRALEEGNFNAFSAPVYIRGFVRTYATLLKLDVTQLMAALDQELGKTDKFREPPPLTEQPHTVVDFITLQLSKVNWRAASRGLIATGGVLLLFLIIAIWRHHLASTDPLAHLEPAIYKSAQSGETLPLPASPNR